MRRINLVTLKLFVSIADEGRLTAAAAREHMALAAVSKRISDLEALLGTALLYRKPRGVELTPAGHALLHHARNVLENMEHLQADLSEYSAGVRGHVRMYANTSAIIEFLPEDLSRFTRAHPAVKIDLEEGISVDIVHAVREGLSDIGIFAGHVPTGHLTTYPYRSDRLVLVTPAAHPLAERSAIRLKEAMIYDFVGLQQDSSLQNVILDAARDAGERLRMRIQVRSFEGICRMIHHGMGVGVLPEKAVTSHIRSLQLGIVTLSDPWAHRQLRLGIRDYATLSMLGRQMVDHLIASDPPCTDQTTQPAGR